eukprot:1904761-Prymnesium_polylepis.1
MASQAAWRACIKVMAMHDSTFLHRCCRTVAQAAGGGCFERNAVERVTCFSHRTLLGRPDARTLLYSISRDL